MSEMDQKRTSHQVRVRSAIPPKADIVERDRHVRFVPKADIRLRRPISDELIYINAVGRYLTWSVVAQEAD
jgi:hypothetical protein